MLPETRGRGESLVAVFADEWFRPVVGPGVLFKQPVGGEAFAARGAYERPLSSVFSRVDNQIGVVEVLGATLLAVVSLPGPIVRLQVGLQGRAADETFAAAPFPGAVERPLPCMPPLVHCQVRLLYERLLTDFAGVRAFVGVSPDVFGQRGGSGKGRVASGAHFVLWPFLGLESRVHRLDVVVDVRLLDEALVAHGAIVRPFSRVGPHVFFQRALGHALELAEPAHPNLLSPFAPRQVGMGLSQVYQQLSLLVEGRRAVRAGWRTRRVVVVFHVFLEVFGCRE